MIRNCSGRTPPRAPVVEHPQLPRAVLMPECPMRSVRHPDVRTYLPLFAACRRLGVLPRAGGYEDQDARTMAAWDVMAASLEESPPSGP